MKLACQSLAAVTLLAGASLAQAATTVTFDSQSTTDFVGTVGDGTTYTESGFTFTSTAEGGLATWGSSAGDFAADGGTTLFENFPGDSIVVTAAGGGSFTLNSFDMASVYNDDSTGDIAFAYTDGSGSHAGSLALAGHPGLATYHVDLGGLTSFSLTQDSPYFQIDNVVFDAAAVPEPGLPALMAAGLLLVAGASRRRRT